VQHCSRHFWCIPQHLPCVPKQFFFLSIFLLRRVSFIQRKTFCAFFEFFNWLVVPAGDDTSTDWKQLKEQLCNCGDANVAAFLSNFRRSNAVLKLSLASLALLRPLRASVSPNSLFSTHIHHNEVDCT
jgi:hypothetical protein